MNHVIPQWRVLVDGELYGAYVHRDDADLAAERLRRKGRKVKVTKRLGVW